MPIIEASGEFAIEVAKFKNVLDCGLHPDRDNAACSSFRIKTQLPTVSREYSEFATHSLQEVPVVCIHCIGVRQEKWAPGDLIVKKE
jgi:hypothetical protein